MESIVKLEAAIIVVQFGQLGYIINEDREDCFCFESEDAAIEFGMFGFCKVSNGVVEKMTEEEVELASELAVLFDWDAEEVEGGIR